MGHGPLDEPLKPVCKPSSPPWVSPYTGRKYTGRLEWWADLAYKDPLWRAGKYRGQNCMFQEQDKYWYDPPVEDGKSFSGPNGVDGFYNTNLSVKADQPGNFYEFQDKVMKNSHQYKQIAAKWDLSKEHPGLDVNPTLGALMLTPASQIGKLMAIPNMRWHWGPRFWDKPINEGCLEKGLCFVKYASIGTFAFAVMHLKANPPPNMPYSWGWTTIFKRWIKFLPIPCTCGFVYGTSLCASATIRNVDDAYNFLAASTVLGMTVSTIANNNVTAGILAAASTFLVGFITQYARTNPKGLQNRVTQQSSHGLHFGPLTWKWFNQGDAEVPKTYY